MSEENEGGFIKGTPLYQQVPRIVIIIIIMSGGQTLHPELARIGRNSI